MRFLILSIIFSITHAYSQDVLWQRDGDLNTSHFGSNIHPLGDQNEDGFADWTVFVSDESGWDSTSLSGVDFYYGGDPASMTPYMRFRGEMGDRPWRILDVEYGDFNGDSQLDWLVVRWQMSSDSGYISFYSGGVDADTIPEEVWVVTGFFNTNASVGQVGEIGDHNGDGSDDFYYYDSRPSDLTTVYLGSPTWDFQVAYVTQGEPIFSGESRPSGNDTGDFNGDGFDDYPTWYDDTTKFFFGSATPDTIPDLIWAGTFSFDATMQVDLSEDGFDDLIIHRGASIIDVHLGSTDPSITPSGFMQYSACESSAPWLRSAGDFNRDGYEDLAVVNQFCNSGFGRIALFAGGPYIRTTPVWEENGSVNGLMVGIYCAVGVGDINNDGIDDLAVGCQNGFNRRGRVIILPGDTTLILPTVEQQPIASDFSLSIYPNPVNGVATLDISSEHVSGPLGVVVYNILGQQVDRFTLNSNLQTRYSYNVAPLASGQYIVQVYNNTSAAEQKLVVLK